MPKKKNIAAQNPSHPAQGLQIQNDDIFSAAQRGDIEKLKYFCMDQSINPNTADVNGKYAAEYALINKQFDAAITLFNAGAICMTIDSNIINETERLILYRDKVVRHNFLIECLTIASTNLKKLTAHLNKLCAEPLGEDVIPQRAFNDFKQHVPMFLNLLKQRIDGGDVDETKYDFYFDRVTEVCRLLILKIQPDFEKIVMDELFSNISVVNETGQRINELINLSDKFASDNPSDECANFQLDINYIVTQPYALYYDNTLCLELLDGRFKNLFNKVARNNNYQIDINKTYAPFAPHHDMLVTTGWRMIDVEFYDEFKTILLANPNLIWNDFLFFQMRNTDGQHVIIPSAMDKCTLRLDIVREILINRKQAFDFNAIMSAKFKKNADKELIGQTLVEYLIEQGFLNRPDRLLFIDLLRDLITIANKPLPDISGLFSHPEGIVVFKEIMEANNHRIDINLGIPSIAYCLTQLNDWETINKVLQAYPTILNLESELDGTTLEQLLHAAKQDELVKQHRTLQEEKKEAERLEKYAKLGALRNFVDTQPKETETVKELLDKLLKDKGVTVTVDPLKKVGYSKITLSGPTATLNEFNNILKSTKIIPTNSKKGGPTKVVAQQKGNVVVITLNDVSDNVVMENIKLKQNLIQAIKAELKQSHQTQKIENNTQDNFPGVQTKTEISNKQLQDLSKDKELIDNWQRALENAFCRGVKVLWNKAELSFEIHLPETNAWHVRLYNDAWTNFQTYHFSAEIIESIISRVNAYLKANAQIKWDKLNHIIKIGVYDASVPDVRKLDADVSKSIINSGIQPIANVQTDQKRSPQSTQATVKKKLIVVERDTVLTNKMVVETIHNIFAYCQVQATGRCNDFAFLLNDVVANNNRWIFSYNLAGHKVMNGMHTAEFFKAVEKELGDINPNFMHITEQHENMIVFTIDGSVISPNNMLDKLQTGTNNQIKENFKSALLSDTSIEPSFTAYIKENDEVKSTELPTEIKQLNKLTKIRKQTLAYHLKRLQAIQSPHETDISKQALNFFAYLFNIFRILALLDDTLRNETNYRTTITEWRNVIRHAYNDLEWEDFYAKMQPFCVVMKNALKPDKHSHFQDEFNFNAVIANLDQALIPFKSAIANKTLGGSTKNKLRDKVSYAAQLDEILANANPADSFNCEDAALMLAIILAETNSKSPYEFLYGDLGHKGFDEISQSIYLHELFEQIKEVYLGSVNTAAPK